MPHSAGRVQAELTRIADRLEVLTAEKRKLESRRAEWLARGLQARRDDGRPVSYRDMASWARITSARVSQILKRDEPTPATTG